MAFLNADTGNRVIIASQTYLLRHPDVEAFRLAEVTDDQARSYLDGRIEPGTFDQLWACVDCLLSIP